MNHIDVESKPKSSAAFATWSVLPPHITACLRAVVALLYCISIYILYRAVSYHAAQKTINIVQKNPDFVMVLTFC